MRARREQESTEETIRRRASQRESTQRHRQGESLEETERRRATLREMARSR